MRTILGLVAAWRAGVGLDDGRSRRARTVAFKVEREIVAHTVNADGSHTEAREQTIRVLKDSALDSAKSLRRSVTAPASRKPETSAYTLKADGRRIPVPAGNFQVSSSAGQNGGLAVPDQTTLTAVFPDLAVGDAAVFSYRLEASKPMFDGQFSVELQPHHVLRRRAVNIDAPGIDDGFARNLAIA